MTNQMFFSERKAPWPESPVYQISIEGVKVALMSDGSVLGWTAGYVNCEPSGSLAFADSGRAWIPKHKSFNSLARQMFRDGDFDEFLKFRQERQARKASMKAAAPELYAALDLALSHMSEPDCVIWRDIQSRAKSALAKARGETQ